ncbi:plasmid pRiA4b ORF-3 family protein [Microtetraspora malaysiensis]|uniref:plasmid pRiA4b ORF-3 family protein n=1 Tax=Microtetraspora malaysiensis TaxID=161358 RepID=UPI003D944D97
MVTEMSIGCAVFAAARALASWVGSGRAVTAGGALKPALVPEAARTIGVGCPAKVRRLSDVPEAHRAWVTALAAGLVTISGTRAVQDKNVAEPDITAWYAALGQVVAAQVTDPCDVDPRICCLVTLVVLTDEEPPLGAALRTAVENEMRVRRGWDWRAAGLIERHPVDQVVGILRDFGALDARLAVTALGEYARRELQRDLPSPITPELTAAEVLKRLATAPEEDADELLWRWRIPDDPRSTSLVDRLPELLWAAGEASPAGRVSVIEAVAARGENSEPLWQAVRDHPVLGPHARQLLGKADSVQDRRWLTIDFALAALERYSAKDAWYVLKDMMSGDLHADVRDSGHPEAARLLKALPTASLRIPVYQLKISLFGGLWRRVLVPENYSLGALHRVIQALFSWSGDHLHLFEHGKRRYTDPFYPLENCGDEELCRLNRALPAPRTKLTYTYDLGDCWRHEIVLEKILDPELDVPICVDGHGDNPIEDYNPDYPEEPVPFDRNAVNRTLAECLTGQTVMRDRDDDR